jgi:hypothetical protein
MAPIDDLADWLHDMAPTGTEYGTADFLITYINGVTAIMPLTEEADVWFEANVDYEDWQLHPGIGVIMERRDAADVIEVIRTGTPFTIGTG